jgi:hypothetical protein
VKRALDQFDELLALFLVATGLAGGFGGLFGELGADSVRLRVAAGAFGFPLERVEPPLQGAGAPRA